MLWGLEMIFPFWRHVHLANALQHADHCCRLGVIICIAPNDISDYFSWRRRLGWDGALSSAVVFDYMYQAARLCFQLPVTFFSNLPLPLHPLHQKIKIHKKNRLKQQEDADVERVNRRNDRRFVRIETQDFFLDTFYLKCETREVREIKMEEF